MNREEFTTKYRKNQKTLAEIYKEQRELEEEYLATNQPFPIGTKVKITYPSGKNCYDHNSVNTNGGSNKCEIFGFIKEYVINFVDLSIEPKVAKINKDGKACAYAEWNIDFTENPIIEVCNN